MDKPTPNLADAPGAWPETPYDVLQNASHTAQDLQNDTETSDLEALTPTRQTLTSYFGREGSPGSIAGSVGLSQSQQRSPSSSVPGPYQLGAGAANTPPLEPTEMAPGNYQTQPVVAPTVQTPVPSNMSRGSETPSQPTVGLASRVPTRQADPKQVDIVSSESSTSTSTAVPSRESPSSEVSPAAAAATFPPSSIHQSRDEQPYYEPLKTVPTRRSEVIWKPHK